MRVKAICQLIFDCKVESQLGTISKLKVKIKTKLQPKNYALVYLWALNREFCQNFYLNLRH